MQLRLLILLVAVWLVAPLAVAEARLVVGAAPEVTHGLASAERARQLAATLAMALKEEVELKLFPDRTQLSEALANAADVDLGIFDADFLAGQPGKLLVIGPLDQHRTLLIATRQWARNGLSQRVAAALLEFSRPPADPVHAAAPPVLPVLPPPPSPAAPAEPVPAPAGGDALPSVPAGMPSPEMPAAPQLSGAEPAAAAPPSPPLVAAVAAPAPAGGDVLPPAPVGMPSPEMPAAPQRSGAEPATAAPPSPPLVDAVAEPAPTGGDVLPPAPAGLPSPEMPAAPQPPGETAVITVPSALPAGTAGEAPVPPPAPSVAPAVAGDPAESPVPDIIAQPDLPQELRPPGVPVARPGRLPQAAPTVEQPPLLAGVPEPIGKTPKPSPLLPEPDPEPGVVYVVPFLTLMVPDAVRERIFDQFVDTLNQTGANRQLRFVIVKQGIDKIDRTWLGARKYVIGEIFSYVEDSGCCSTDLRAKARLTYYRSHQAEPALAYEYPVKTFFEHDRSNIDDERRKLSDQIANALVAELTKALQY